MKEFIVASWDDLELVHGLKTPADTTVHLGLDGTWYELDLTGEHRQQLLDDLKVYLDASHKPDGINEDPAASKRSYKNDPENTKRNRMLRDFADKHGLNYRTETGKYYYSTALLNSFDAFQAGAPESEWRTIYEQGVTRKKRGPS